MSARHVNSLPTLSLFIGFAMESYEKHGEFYGLIDTEKKRSIPQNNFTHAWYAQIARELREDDALGWKCYCKLHHGVPILRAENEQYRETYDLVIKPLSYENKLIAMREWPVTSQMNKRQLSRYAEMVQADFHDRGVLLEFPA